MNDEQKNSSIPDEEQFIKLDHDNQKAVLEGLLDRYMILIDKIDEEQLREFVLRAVLFLDQEKMNNILLNFYELQHIYCISPPLSPLLYSLQNLDDTQNLTYSELITYVRNKKILPRFNAKFRTMYYNRHEFGAENLKEFLRYMMDQMIEDPKFGLTVSSRRMEYIDEDDRKLKQRLFKVNDIGKREIEISRKYISDIRRYVVSSHFYNPSFLDQFRMIQRKIKTMNRLRKYSIPVFPLKFKVERHHPAFTPIRKKRILRKTPHQQLHQLIEEKINLPDCRLELYQNLAVHPDYGYIVATLIYMGCVQENYPMEQLQYSWISMRNEILKTIKSLPKHDLTYILPHLYYQLQNNLSYSYCTDKFNFITQYYLNDYCNCECGSFLVFKLCSMLPKLSTERFMCILILGHIQLLYGTSEKQYIFETTAISETEMNRDRIDENEFIHGITNERVLALYMIGMSIGRRLPSEYEKTTDVVDRIFIRNFIARELGIKPFTGPITEIGKYLNTINTSFLTNPMDCTMLFYIVYSSFVQTTNWDEVILLCKSYIITDYKDFFNNKVYTRINLNKREVDFGRQLQKISNDYPTILYSE